MRLRRRGASSATRRALSLERCAAEPSAAQRATPRVAVPRRRRSEGASARRDGAIGNDGGGAHTRASARRRRAHARARTVVVGIPLAKPWLGRAHFNLVIHLGALPLYFGKSRALQQQLAPRPVYAKHHNHKRNLDSTSIIQQRTSASSPPPYRPESPMALPRRKNTEDDGRGGFCSIRRFVRRAATVPSGTVHHASKRRTVFRRHRQLAIALVLRHSLGPELRGGRSAQRRTSLTSADDDGRRDATVHTSFCRGSARRVVPARSLRSARLVPSPSPLHRTLRRVADLVFLFECWQALAKGTAWARVDVQFIIIVPSPC